MSLLKDCSSPIMSQIPRMHCTIIVVLLILAGACSPMNDSETEGQKNLTLAKASIEDVDRGIRAYIEHQTRTNDGYFVFEGDSSSLNLKLVRVHTEYLSVLGANDFFACVDLATESGDVFDVDFFLSGTRDSMNVIRTKLHKLNGKPYYTWKQAKDKTWYTVPIKNASNDLLGIIEDQDRFQFTYTVQLPAISHEAKIWIPLAQTDSFQQILSRKVAAPSAFQILTDADFGNEILFLQLAPQQEEQIIEIKYDVLRKEKSPYQDKGKNIQKYLGSSPLIPVNDRFSTLGMAIVAERKAETPLAKARALYDYIIDNMRYAKQGTYGTGDANFACDSKSGNCTEFHSLFIALARSVDIPARFAVGASIPSDRNEGGIDGYHCWAEFYAEGKWWPVDISEANKYTPLATYYFGHHPANRIELSTGRDLQVNPGPASGSIPFLAYPILEIQDRSIQSKTTFTFQRKKESDT